MTFWKLYRNSLNRPKFHERLPTFFVRKFFARNFNVFPSFMKKVKAAKARCDYFQVYRTQVKYINFYCLKDGESALEDLKVS